MRRLGTILVCSGLCLGIVALVFMHPMCRRVPAPTVRELLADEPLNLTPLLDRLGEYLNTPKGLALRDSWGLHAGPSGRVAPEAFRSSERVHTLNAALTALAEARFSAARTPLSRHYHIYNRDLGRDDGDEADLIPSDVEGKLLYGLYRYNRAVLQFSLAEINGRDPKTVDALLKAGLNDLRRTVAAFEQLGDVRDINGTYWGAGAHAWDGYALEDAHGGLPMSHVYINLALAYLRLGETPGYPYKNTNYLAKEYAKYSWGEDQMLTPIVNELVRYALRAEGRELSLRRYRLIMALHNMEAAGRGSMVGRKDLHYYTVALLLNQLADTEDLKLGRDRVMDFLKLARSVDPEGPVFQAAGKELSLLLLREGRGGEAMEVLRSLDAGRMADLLAGPQADGVRDYLDILQLPQMADGDLDVVYNHWAGRRGSRDMSATQASGVGDLIAGGFFEALHQRLTQTSSAVHGAVLHRLSQDPALAGEPALHAAFEAACLQKGRRDPRVWVNVALHRAPTWFFRLKGLAVCLFLGLIGYLVWCYRSHRRVARRMFDSTYGRESA